MIELGMVASFVAIALVVYLVGRRLQAFAHNPVEERVAQVTGGGNGAVAPAPGAFRAVVDGLAQQIPQPHGHAAAIKQDLRQAGHYKPTALEDYLALRNALILSAIVLAGLSAVVIGPRYQRYSLYALGGGLFLAGLAWALPRMLVKLKASRRTQRIRKALPDVLDFIAMCLSGGLSLRQSLDYVSRELAAAYPDLAIELTIVRRQADMNSLSFAFEQLSQRVDAPEIASLQTLVVQNEMLGTSVADSIREYADNMRLQRRQEAREEAGKTSVKLLLPVALCLVPSAMMLLWGPSLLELMDFFRNFQGMPPLTPG